MSKPACKMSDATYLLTGTAMNLVKDEKGIEEGHPDLHCACQDPPFLNTATKMVCSDPPIWIFDGMLSEALLERVDASFDGVGWKSMNGRKVRMVELDIDDKLSELTQTLRNISHIDDIGPCNKAWIMDVHGRPQGPHVDGWELERNNDRQFLDLSKNSVQSHNGFHTIIPSLSFVVYFNDSGGIAFPRADLKHPIIPAKRGRIVMFSNYDDAHRPAHNPKAVHYGVYGDVPKRVMTAGVMSNETPSNLTRFGDTGTTKTRGFLYAPIMHRSNSACGDRTPTPPRREPPKPKPVLELFARRAEAGGFIVEATNLTGEAVSKALIPADATWGQLRRELNVEGQFTSSGQLLDGKDERQACHVFVQGMAGPDLEIELTKLKAAKETEKQEAQEAAVAKERAEQEAAEAEKRKAAAKEQEAAEAEKRKAAMEKEGREAVEKEELRLRAAAQAYAKRGAKVGDVICSIASFSNRMGRTMEKGSVGTILIIDDTDWQVQWSSSKSWVNQAEHGKFMQEGATDAEDAKPASAGKEVEWDVIDTVFAEKSKEDPPGHSKTCVSS
mmetsp:Transcript_29455/g.53467  ORF Transcript_29455/g.53467 Transcript_29455/m.53467 type:complete len:557 (+) Transcript_29455:87-1757(+)